MILLPLILEFFLISGCDLSSGFLLKRKGVHDYNLTTTEIIEKYGYKPETHELKTEDGYIITFHRIPHGKDSKKIGFPILLVHGVFLDSSSFLLYGKNSLAFYLADEGYDVWLMNTRGNHYGKNHRTLSPKHKKFWDFSWHEFGTYDLPSHIDYILDYTDNNDLLVLAMSMGSTIFFVTASERPEYQKKIRGSVLLAPVSSLKYIKTPLLDIAPAGAFIQSFTEIESEGKYFDHDPLYQRFSKELCTLTATHRKFCKNMFFVFSGNDNQDSDEETLANFVAHSPSGSSSKTIIHYMQNVNSGKFRQYDYGVDKNFAKYGSSSPPEYNLTSITTPMSLFAGATDYLADPEDIRETLSRLPAVKSIYYIPCRNFNHMDFLLTKNMNELIINEVGKHLKYFMNPKIGIEPKNYVGSIINPEQFPICS